MEKNKNNIFSKLQKIQQKIEQLEKSEFNKFQSYKYFTEYGVLKLCKPLLSEQKLILILSDEIENFKVEKLEDKFLVSYRKKATLINAEDPNEKFSLYVWALGSNQDPAKAKGSAETYAVKYFLQKLFLIPTSDKLDPDYTNNTIEDKTTDKNLTNEKKAVNDFFKKYSGSGEKK